ncbi:MAG: acyl carrier protein [Actinomycetota bacterium]|nr:acyl carrier protein [Actinomycetota bacterium]MDQ2956656.1 acyl carrier protein [Actinomycetota bacterium]
MSQSLPAAAEDVRLDLIGMWQEIVPAEQSLTGADAPRHRGGDSLALLRLISKIEDRWQVQLSIREMFGNPTFDELAALIASRQA